MVRLFLAFISAAFAIWLVAGAVSSGRTSASPTVASATPDPFVAQVTNSARNSFAGDMSADGRFVVIESEGDISTEKTATRNNTDGNGEIFLYDYAQRRVFQITNTRPVVNPTATPSPSPSPSPTASPTPTPVDPSNIKVAITNTRPMISMAPALDGSNQRTYRIVFSSNAPNPANFDGTDSPALDADANEEIWVYQLPPVSDVALNTGADQPLQDLAQGTFTQVTNTTASRAPTAGSSTQAPFVADDNREGSISDDGQRVVFISVRDLTPGAPGNADGNPEVYLTTVGSGTFIQATNTHDGPGLFNPVVNQNPSISLDGSAFAFVSNANLTGNNNDDGNGNGNFEIYWANFNGSAVSNLRQVTRTKATNANEATTNIFSHGSGGARRLSRNGNFIAFNSLANDPKANGANATSYAVFVYSVIGDSFAQVEPRALSGGDVVGFPTFTDYDNAGAPASVVFISGLNFLPNGDFPTVDQDSTGLNPQRSSQIFIAPIPSPSASPTGPFTRITNLSAGAIALPPMTSNTRGRMAFSFFGELGGGNNDFANEVFYHLSPANTSEPAASISIFTGASLIPVTMPAASPGASPSPSPSATPFVAAGLAAGELGVLQATVPLAPSTAQVNNNSASYAGREPALPVELNGVSVSINRAACGLYFVGPSQINFVVPIGLTPNASGASYPIVINNNGTVLRGLIVIVAAQPDIFTSSNNAGGRAVVFNVTNPMTPTGEPFNVTSNDGTGMQVPTVLEIHLTGVRGTNAAAVSVTIGTTAIVPSKLVSTDLPGFDQLLITLPSTVDRGDLPIVVTAGSTSRPASSAPHITINP